MGQVQEVNIMLTKLARLTQKVSGSVLGSFAVAIQAGNVMVCIALLVFGPDVILHFLPQA